MLKRKLILFLAVAMTGIFAGSSYFMPNVLAVGESETQPSGDEETVPGTTPGDTDDGSGGGNTEPPSTGDNDTDEDTPGQDTGTGDDGGDGNTGGGDTSDSGSTGGNSEGGTSKPGGSTGGSSSGSTSKPGSSTGGSSSGSTSKPGSSTGGSSSGSISKPGSSTGGSSSGSISKPSSTGGSTSSVIEGGVSTEVTDSEEGDASPSDSMLRSLTFSSGTLEPEFDSSTYEYTLTLDSPVTTLTVRAVAFNIYSEVKGDGEIPLTADRNQIVITCTDLLGNARNYVVHLTGSALESGVIMENYTYISDFEADTIPDGFEESQVQLDDSEAAGIHSDFFNVDAVCMEDPEGNRDFYIVSNGEVTSQNVIMLELAGGKYLLMPVTIDLKLRSGFTWATAEIENKMVPGWKYNDGEENFFQMYLRNEEQEDFIYQYDVQEQTLQKFDDELMISSDEYQQAVNDLNKTAHRENIKYTLEFLLLILAGGFVCLVLLYMQNKGTGRMRRRKRSVTNEGK